MTCLQLNHQNVSLEGFWGLIGMGGLSLITILNIFQRDFFKNFTWMNFEQFGESRQFH